MKKRRRPPRRSSAKRQRRRAQPRSAARTTARPRRSLAARLAPGLRSGLERIALLHTPATRRGLLDYAVGFLLAQPLVTARYHWVERELGGSLPGAGSIAAPIFWATLGWIAALPLGAAAVWACTRRYPGRVSLRAWSHERPLRSALWTAAFAALIAGAALGPWAALLERHPLEIADSLVLTHLLLVLRAAVVAAAPTPAGERAAGSASAVARPVRAAADRRARLSPRGSPRR